MLSLQPANRAVISKWLKFAALTGATSGVLSIVNVVRSIFPEALLQRYPDYDSLIYAALAISIISGLFLMMVDKVIVVSFAQLGGITSLIYIGYSLAGIFGAALLPVFAVLMALAILTMVLIFGQSLAFFLRRRAYADLTLGAIFVLAATFICAYPLYLIMRPALFQ